MGEDPRPSRRSLGSTWRMTLGSDRAPNRLIDPFFGTRKSRFVTGGVLVGLLGLVIVANVFGGTGIEAKITHAVFSPGVITYTTEVDPHRDEPVDLQCDIHFELVDDIGAGYLDGDSWRLSQVQGTVTAPHVLSSYRKPLTLTHASINCEIAPDP